VPRTRNLNDALRNGYGKGTVDHAIGSKAAMIDISKRKQKLTIRCSKCASEVIASVSFAQLPKLRCSKCGGRHPIVMLREAVQRVPRPHVPRQEVRPPGATVH
jgi:DNA-directed RNA polymerase subunit RPC12/RpoP